jgi:4-diphosphocytidyl-2C-methyl-D-erythritol kinase
MAIPPLFTEQELLTQIAAFKQAMLELAGGKRVRLNTNGADREVTSEDLPELRKQLEWLQSERVKLVSGSGPVFLAGRPRR